MADRGNVVSRREFLKMAGVAGATVGIAAGLGGVIAGCGGGEVTTTTASPTATSVAATTTSVAQTSTTQIPTTGSSAATGRPYKIGFVSPLTGRLATFGIADKYCLERWNEYAADGLVLGDGQKHPIEIIIKDSQSDSNRAAQVAGDLINNDKIDLMIAASTPDTTIPVSDQCEANGTPCATVDTPWDPWFMGRGGDPKVGFKWTNHACWGTADLVGVYFGFWGQIANNKVYGALWPNDADGNAYRKTWPAAFKERAYTLSDAGPFEDGLEDYSQMISLFKKAGAELCGGPISAPDFTNFWKQSMQQGYRPKAFTSGKACNLVKTIAALGSLGEGLTTIGSWAPYFPFKSSLTGETCQEIAADFEKRVGQQWVQTLYHYALFEWVVDALKRTKNVDDKAAVSAAIGTTKMDTTMGPIDFTAPIGAGSVHPVPNVSRTFCSIAQWEKTGTGQYPLELLVVDNTGWPQVPVQQKARALTY